MGSRNPDRIPLHLRRTGCETVGQMLKQRWHVEAWCEGCRLKLRVDLRTIATVRGAGFSLWGKASRCRKVGCRGAVRFYAQAPGMSAVEPLISPVGGPEGGPAWLRPR